MAVAFQAASAAIGGAGSSSGTITWPGVAGGQMLIAVFGFEGVAAGSGPWISGAHAAGGWKRTLYQSPSANGSGLEVWDSGPWSSSTTTQFDFTTTETFVARGVVYTGQYASGSNPLAVRAYAVQGWTGNNPATPAFYSFAGEMLVAVAADTLAAGYGTPTPAGSTARIDSSRIGAGTVEITAADDPSVSDGTVGPFVWTVNANPGGALGATGVFAIQPSATPVASTAPFLNLDVPLT